MRLYDAVFLGTALVDSIVRDLDPAPVSATGYRAASGLLAPGGEAVNGVLTARKLGLDAAIFCSLGRDLAGDLVSAVLEGAGVPLDGVLREERLTPVSTLLVDREGNRRSITNEAHRYNFHPERHLDRLPPGRALVLGSLFRAPFNDPGVVRETLAGVGEGTLLLADTKLPNFRKLTLDDLRDSLPRIDYIFPNEDEGAWCTGQTDPEAMADVLLSYGVKNVIVKLGGKGCFFKNRREAYRLGAFAVEAVDATGAGDNFLAGFLCALLEGKDHREALRFASACGAICTTAQGATAALEDRRQVLELLAARPGEAVAEALPL